MATNQAARLLLRAAARASHVAPRPVVRPSAFSLVRIPKQGRGNGRRYYSSEAAPKSGGSGGIIFAAVAAIAGGGGYYLYSTGQLDSLISAAGIPAKEFVPTQEDYVKIYNEVAKRLVEFDEYDDGSYGPVLVRLAWHASGTYDVETKTGGSNGATMRFQPESDHGANAGLKAARDFLEPVKEKFPWVSYSDLWILSGVCALQQMGGPVIPWRPGRSDRDISACTPDGRLPDATKEHKHLRAIFGRMGFNDQEIVALSGAHALGRCHTDRSGFDGPWTFSPTMLTNDYYKLLVNEKWNWKKWNGPAQYEDKTKALMMLPTDMALVKDREFKKWVDKYAKDQDVFFKDFSDVIVKLFELGVPFKQEERWTFKVVE
ncbi:heme peroxidase [Orbilia oligospora]|uniref:Peroxidase n=1 Tax=Orbilia oligospora TaxID=2813651 RepID=A0A6G1LWL2_ORBOL|nr:heme peroxidase [Orbilia oligospora]KAF3203202.1 heme peroxidase [Orbilia oligospora]KAF3212120.1 heme peroxidase [Orbilia oligospora]KAF3231697.1 heme peroxidase [Orbilia oligospora]KAF3236573.1 heme peroxidase [Orbilia oligospora]